MSKNAILEEFEQYKGQFVIDDNWDVVRLVGVLDGKLDYYWTYWNGREMRHCSCVGGFVPLKGKIDDEHYAHFVHLAYWNHYDLIGLNNEKEKDKTKLAMWKTMRERVKMEAVKTKGEDKYITDICWDLK